MSAPAGRPDGAPRRLPRGRHGLPRAVVVENQRARIFGALAGACAELGYGEVTVREITERAGVSRRTFYDLFTDKEQCFLAAYDAIIDRLIGEVGAAYGPGERPWPERIAAALRAVISRYVSEPELARLVTVEVLGAGRAALERRDRALKRFAIFLEPARAGLPALAGTELLAQAVIGGLYEALYTYVVEDRVAELPALYPDLLYCVLVPYLGHPAALALCQLEVAPGRAPPGAPSS